MSECKCDMRTKLVGDGCEVCNPEQTLEYARDTIADLEKERDELARENAAIRELMNAYNLGGWTDSLSLMKERDGLAAQVEVVRGELIAADECLDESGLSQYGRTRSRILEVLNNLETSDALREIQARTLEDAAFKLSQSREASAYFKLRELAAAIRKGE